MSDPEKTKEQLVIELNALRRQVAQSMIAHHFFDDLGFLPDLLEQTGIFKRNAHTGGNSLQKTDFTLSVSVYPFVIFQYDAADHAVRTNDRNHHT